MKLKANSPKGIDIFEVIVIHGKSKLIFGAIYAFRTNFRCHIFATLQLGTGKVNFSNPYCNAKQFPK